MNNSKYSELNHLVFNKIMNISRMPHFEMFMQNDLEKMTQTSLVWYPYEATPFSWTNICVVLKLKYNWIWNNFTVSIRKLHIKCSSIPTLYGRFAYLHKKYMSSQTRRLQMFSFADLMQQPSLVFVISSHCSINYRTNLVQIKAGEF